MNCFSRRFIRAFYTAWIAVLIASCSPALLAPTQTLPARAKTAIPIPPTKAAPPSAVPATAAASGVFPLDPDPKTGALLRYILEDLTGEEKQHLFILQVKPNPAGVKARLNVQEKSWLRAWLYQDRVLQNSTPSAFFNSYTHETAKSPWKYSYFVFSIVEIRPDFLQASVRIDRTPGLAGGKGQLYELSFENDRWNVKKESIVWIQ